MADEEADKENPKEGGWENEEAMYDYEFVKVIDVPNSWYFDLKHYLSTRSVPTSLDA